MKENLEFQGHWAKVGWNTAIYEQGYIHLPEAQWENADYGSKEIPS